jgi:hypothetical protein
MADSNTANLGLFLPDLNDTYNFSTQVETNFTTLDTFMGAVDCTSTSRPSNTYKGQIVYEHDTGRYAQNTGTKASPVWTYTSHAAAATLSTTLPTSGLSNGFMVYATDTNALLVSDGGVLRYKTIVSCTSTTRPASGTVETGAVIYETDTGQLLVWSGSGWAHKTNNNFVCTSTTHPSFAFQGLDIYETDTGMSAIYSGSNYQYQLQQIAPTQTVSGASSVTFSSIPAVKRLLVLWRARYGTTGSTDLLIQMDGDTTAHYAWSKLTGRGAAASASDSAGAVNNGRVGVIGGTTASYPANGAVWIDGWNQSNTFATYTGNNATWDTATSYWNEIYSGIYGVAGPHNSIKLFLSSGTMTGEFSIYGAM